MINLGQKIKWWRQERCLSLERLGELSGTSKSYIWSLENDKDANPTIDKLVALTYALDLTINALINERQNSKGVEEESAWNQLNKLSSNDRKRIFAIIKLFKD